MRTVIIKEYSYTKLFISLIYYVTKLSGRLRYNDKLESFIK